MEQHQTDKIQLALLTSGLIEKYTAEIERCLNKIAQLQSRVEQLRTTVSNISQLSEDSKSEESHLSNKL